MPSLITLQGIDETFANLELKPGTLKAELARVIRSYFVDDQSVQAITSIPTDEIVLKIWGPCQAEELKAKKKNFSSLKSALNKSLKDLDKAGKNQAGIILGRDNVFIVSEERKDDLLKQMGISPNSPHLLHDMFAAFKKFFSENVPGQNIQEVKQEVRQDVKQATTEANQKIQVLRKETVEQFQKQREEAKEQIQQKREEVKNAVEVRREELKTTIAAKREALKDRLQVVRDEKKKQAVERIYTTLNAINERMTDHFLNVLDQVEDVLDRVQGRSDKAKANDLDVSSAQTAIDAAHRAIDEARTAVREQAAKSYSITVTDEATLRENAKSAKEQLRKDLEAAKDAVKAARDSVRIAAVALAQIPRVDEVEVSSESVTE